MPKKCHREEITPVSLASVFGFLGTDRDSHNDWYKNGGQISRTYISQNGPSVSSRAWGSGNSAVHL